MSTQGQKEIPYREWSRQKGGLAAVATVTCQKLCFAAAGQQNERSVPERESPTIPVTYKNEVYYSTTTFWTLTLSPFTRRSRKTPAAASKLLLQLPLICSLLRMRPVTSTICKVAGPSLLMTKLPLLKKAKVSESVEAPAANTSLKRLAASVVLASKL